MYVSNDSKKELIKKLSVNKYFYIGLSILMFGIILNQLSSWWLYDNFEGKLPVLNDLILDNLPYYRIQWVYDIFPLFAISLFVIYAYKYELANTPYFLLLFGILQIVRGIFICLTPFSSPCLDEPLRILNTSAFRYGVYPSGHTGATFLAYLLTNKKTYKILLLFCSIGVIITLLLARGHYSIDIFSALIFAYAIYSFGNKHLNKFNLR